MKEETNAYKHMLRRVEALEFAQIWEKAKDVRPQDDVPMDIIIFYIVKDYRRMFNTYDKLLKKKEKLEEKVRKMADSNSKQNSDATALINKYKKALAEAKESRSSVVEAVTDDLQQQLKELKERNEILAQALAGAGVNSGNTRIINRTIELSLPAEREWMKRSLQQLNEADIKLNNAIQRLELYQEYAEKSAKEGILEDDAKRIFKKIGQSLSRIDSAIDHISMFFLKVGDIELE